MKTLDEVCKDTVIKRIKKYGRNIKCIKSLGMSRATFYRKIRKWGLIK